MHLKLLKDFPAYYEVHTSLHSDIPFTYAFLLLCHVLRAKPQIRSAQSQVYGCPVPRAKCMVALCHVLRHLEPLRQVFMAQSLVLRDGYLSLVPSDLLLSSRHQDKYFYFLGSVALGARLSVANGFPPLAPPCLVSKSMKFRSQTNRYAQAVQFDCRDE